MRGSLGRPETTRPNDFERAVYALDWNLASVSEDYAT
jgi:hypothetical protein